MSNPSSGQQPQELALDIDLEAYATPSGKVSRGKKPISGRDKLALQAEFRRELKAEAVNAEKRIRQRAGEKYRGLGVFLDVRVRAKAKSGNSLVYKEILSRILTPTGARGTQTAIRDAVQKLYPDKPIPKDWTKPLPRWAIDKLKTQIQSSGPPFNALRVTTRTTLSSLHHKAATVVAEQEGEARTFSAKIVVTDTHVFINGKEFKVTPNRSGERTYPHVRLSISALLAALGG